MQQDIEMATSLIDEYLRHIDKSIYKDYVNDLVKLSVLANDKSFVEAMEALSDIAKDDFKIDPAVYIQDFYYNLARKRFQEAALYLDILNMSENLGGVRIGVGEMKNRLLDDALEVGLTEEDLGLKKKIKITEEEKTAMLPADKVLSVADVMYTVGESPVDIDEEKKEKVVVAEIEGETVVPQNDDDSVVEEPSQVTYTVLDVVDRLLEDTNLIMLEPMSEEDIERVVETTTSFQKIQTYVLEEETGEKRVVLRYYNPKGEYINFKDTLRLANFKFNNGEYEESIDLFQELLPKLERPKPFIYAKLGNAYERLGEYSKAIDYYMVAEAQSETDDDNHYSFSKKINNLRKKCEYNGVSILKAESQSGSRETARQYVKENKNN